MKKKVTLDIPDDIHRGDLFYCEVCNNMIGSVQSGTRPVVVIQNDIGNVHSTTLLIAFITSSIKNEEQPTHVIIPKNTGGLTKRSMILLEQIYTIDKCQLTKRIGRIEDKVFIDEIDNAIAVSLGLKKREYSTFRYADIRALCPDCEKKLINTKKISIVRVDPFQRPKLFCDRCGQKKAVWYFSVPQKCFKEVSNKKCQE